MENESASRHNSIESSFFGEPLRAIHAEATGDLDPHQHPMTKPGIFIAGWFVPEPPARGFFAGWQSDAHYPNEEFEDLTDAEIEAKLVGLEAIEVPDGFYDPEPLQAPDGYTAEDRRLELHNAGMSAQGGEW